jgi:phage replication-related protein YjqB (UPF0714/DUF867 family)
VQQRRLGSPRRRLNGADAPQTLAELLRRPGIVEMCVLRSSFGLMAIHGGGLEAMTDVIAADAAERAGASYYAVLHPDDVDHHLPSVRYDPAQSPALRQFLDHVEVVVGVHGYGLEDHWTSLLVGGGNRTLARIVAAEIELRLYGYEVVTDLRRIPPQLRGVDLRNPVNLPRGGGVQLELPPRIRGISPYSPPPGADGLSPPTRALIEGLAEVASNPR